MMMTTSLKFYSSDPRLQIFQEKELVSIFKLSQKVTEKVGTVADVDVDDDVDVDELQPLTLSRNYGAKRQKYGSLANKDSTTSIPTNLIKHKVNFPET